MLKEFATVASRIKYPIEMQTDFQFYLSSKSPIFFLQICATMKIKGLLFSACLFVVQFVVAQTTTHCSNKSKSGRSQASNYLDTRSDSINITHYSIFLDFSTLPVNELHARCVVDFKAKVDQISNIVLDLKGLQ